MKKGKSVSKKSTSQTVILQTTRRIKAKGGKPRRGLLEIVFAKRERGGDLSGEE